MTAFPDLGMAQLRDLSIDTTTIPGRRLLRFTTVIVNVGAGPYTSTEETAVTKRVVDDAGSYREVASRR